MGGGAGHGEGLLEDLVGREGEAELGGGAQDAGGPALEERAEAFFAEDGAGAVAERGVFGFAFAGFDLEPGLDHVAGRGEVGGWHAGDGAGGEELHDADFLVGPFAEEGPFEVVVGREVDAGEGNVAEEAGAGAFVEPD